MHTLSEKILIIAINHKTRFSHEPINQDGEKQKPHTNIALTSGPSAGTSTMTVKYQQVIGIHSTTYIVFLAVLPPAG